jgi:hypothetical protein
MLRFPASFAHGAYAFNQHLNTDGSIKQDGSVNDAVLLDWRRIQPTYRDLRDPLHLAQGGQLGRVHKGMTLISLRGRIEVPDASQQRSLGDRERALKAAFDPYLCYRDSPLTDGAYAFDFTEETADTVTYANGRMLSRYYCRPTAQPSLEELVRDGASRPFSLALIAGDPRMYEQTEQTLVLTPGSPSGNVVNRGTTPAPLKMTIVMTGAGNAGFAITRGGVSFGLNLAGISGSNTFVVIMETCGPYGAGRTVTMNGVNAFSRKNSGPSTWLDAPVGSSNFSINDSTGITSITLAWYSARA